MVLNIVVIDVVIVAVGLIVNIRSYPATFIERFIIIFSFRMVRVCRSSYEDWN